MQKEAPKNENEKNRKLDYTLQTMQSDIKNQGLKSDSMNLSQKKEPVVPIEPKKEIKKPKEEPSQKSFNPFLEKLEPVPETPLKKTPHLKPKMKKSFPEKKSLKNPAIKTDKILTKKPTSLEKGTERKNSLNNSLLIVLFVISSITVFAGVYYFYLSKKNPSPTQNNSSEIQPTKDSTSTNPIPEKLQDTREITLEAENSDLISSIKNKKDELLNEKQYFKINNGLGLAGAPEILDLLEIQFPEEITSELKSGWLMLRVQENVLKLNLIMEINEGASGSVTEFLKNNEYRLPELLKSLFVDEAFVLSDKQIVFQDSGELENVRYYNLVENIDNKSIDWTVIKEKYLILSTSKDSTKILINDLDQKKEVEVDEKNQTEKEGLETKDTQETEDPENSTENETIEE